MSHSNTSISKVARRYAASIFALAKAENKADDLVKTFAELAQALAENPKAVALLRHPQIAKTQKAELLKNALKGADALSLKAIETIALKDRAGYIAEIAQGLLALLRVEKGEVQAVVRSAQALSSEQQTAIAGLVEKQTGKKPVLVHQQDASLIGGFTISIGSTLMDASIHTQLKKMQQALLRQAS